MTSFISEHHLLILDTYTAKQRPYSLLLLIVFKSFSPNVLKTIINILRDSTRHITLNAEREEYILFLIQFMIAKLFNAF